MVASPNPFIKFQIKSQQLLFENNLKQPKLPSKNIPVSMVTFSRRLMAASNMETLSRSESMSSAGEAPDSVLSLVCVECGRPVARLFREYNKGNIRLGRCVSATSNIV